MPKGKPIPDKVKEGLYHAYAMGESTKDMSARTGLAVVTIRRIIREQRKLQEGTGMAHPEKTVKKDGNGGKLVILGSGGFQLTHVTPDGKSHKKRLNGCSAHEAEQQYDKWCSDLDDECEFMRKVERREPVGEPDGLPDIKPVPAPEIQVRPWRDVAKEQEQRIKELEAQIAETKGSFTPTDEDAPMFSDYVIADTEGEKPKLNHWSNDNGSFRVMWMDKPVYVIWAKTPETKFYGAYCTMESALKEVDKLNEMAEFLGNKGAFEVEEVTWR